MPHRSPCPSWSRPSATRSPCNLSGLNVLISKEGDVSINVFFPAIGELKNFEKKHGGFLDTMKKTFLFKSTGFDGVCIFNFDRSDEAA